MCALLCYARPGPASRVVLVTVNSPLIHGSLSRICRLPVVTVFLAVTVQLRLRVRSDQNGPAGHNVRRPSAAAVRC
jgi:hypothetical protein